MMDWPILHPSLNVLYCSSIIEILYTMNQILFHKFQFDAFIDAKIILVLSK